MAADGCEYSYVPRLNSRYSEGWSNDLDLSHASLSQWKVGCSSHCELKDIVLHRSPPGDHFNVWWTEKSFKFFPCINPLVEAQLSNEDLSYSYIRDRKGSHNMHPTSTRNNLSNPIRENRD